MNNPQERAHNSPSLYRSLPQPPLRADQKIITTLALLVLGYYALRFFDAWPSTVKRVCFEWGVWAIPSRLICVVERLLHKFARQSFSEPVFKKEDFGNQQAKISALQRIIGGTNNPVRGVMRRARAMSGLSNVFGFAGDPHPPGLGNWDNSCYQNSVLQGFASLPAFTSSIQQIKQFLDREGESAPTHEALDKFLGILNDLSGRYQYIWTPQVLKSMDSWQQQDAQEYFSKILEVVETETKRLQLRLESKPGLENIRKRKYEDFASPNRATPADASATVGNTVLADVQKTDRSEIPSSSNSGERHSPESRKSFKYPFNGMLAQAVICETCGFSDGLQCTPFNCLTVNMGEGGAATLHELMEEYTDPEEIEGVECENCTKIAQAESDAVEDDRQPIDEDTNVLAVKPRIKSVRRTKSKQMTIGRLPTDLVIHVNRSVFDSYGNREKNRARVRFPFTLGFLDRWCAPFQQSHDVQRTYELKCAVLHYGRHENGHYVAYGKRDKQWYLFNDHLVTQADLEEVLSSGNVFMLFYETVEETQEPETLLSPVRTAGEAAVREETPTSKDAVSLRVVERPSAAEAVLSMRTATSPESAAPAEILPVDAVPEFGEDATSKIQSPPLKTSETPRATVEYASEPTSVDSDDTTSDSPSPSAESEIGEEVHVPTSEKDMTIPAMRTAPPLSPVQQHADLLSAQVVRAV